MLRQLRGNEPADRVRFFAGLPPESRDPYLSMAMIQYITYVRWRKANPNCSVLDFLSRSREDIAHHTKGIADFHRKFSRVIEPSHKWPLAQPLPIRSPTFRVVQTSN